MKFNLFAPAVLALSLFSATTQALPTAPQNMEAVALLKRGGPSVVDAVVDIFVKAQTKVVLEACIDLEVKICADLKVALDVKANVLNLIKAKISIHDLEIKAKVFADAQVKLFIEAKAEILVIAKIKGIVEVVVGEVCGANADVACIKANANAIVVKVEALIEVCIKELIVVLRAELEAHVHAKVEIFIHDLVVDLLHLVRVEVKAIIRLRVKIDVYLKAFVQLCAKLWLKVGIIAKINAL